MTYGILNRTERRLLSLTEIARHFDLGTSTVHNWWMRRATSEFPEPVACRRRRLSGEKGEAWLWDLAEVERWRAAYVPLAGAGGSKAARARQQDRHQQDRLERLFGQ